MEVAPKAGLGIAVLIAIVVLAAVPAAAQTPLFPASVSSANIDCLFGAQCTLTPRDESVDIPLPGITGRAILQSRTFLGANGSRAEGRTAYQYRIDLSNAATTVDFSCVNNLSVKFGPVVKLPYAPGTVLRDVYEIDQGVPGNQVRIASAVQTGDVVTFTFARLVCAGDGVNPGDTSFFFGLASLDEPVRGARVQMDAPGLDDIRVGAFGPRR